MKRRDNTLNEQDHQCTIDSLLNTLNSLQFDKIQAMLETHHVGKKHQAVIKSLLEHSISIYEDIFFNFACTSGAFDGKKIFSATLPIQYFTAENLTVPQRIDQLKKTISSLVKAIEYLSSMCEVRITRHYFTEVCDIVLLHAVLDACRDSRVSDLKKKGKPSYSDIMEKEKTHSSPFVDPLDFPMWKARSFFEKVKNDHSHPAHAPIHLLTLFSDSLGKIFQLIPPELISLQTKEAYQHILYFSFITDNIQLYRIACHLKNTFSSSALIYDWFRLLCTFHSLSQQDQHSEKWEHYYYTLLTSLVKSNLFRALSQSVPETILLTEQSDYFLDIAQNVFGIHTPQTLATSFPR